MKIEFPDPNPKITASLKKKLLSNERRLEIVESLSEKGIVDKMKHSPPFYLVALNHYGSQAFVALDGQLLGHVYEYKMKNEFDDDDIDIADQKLQQLHSNHFVHPTTNELRKRGVNMLSRKLFEGNQAEPSSVVTVRFPDSEGVQIDLRTGEITRIYRGYLWAGECSTGELPVFTSHQVDCQLRMLHNLQHSFSTEKYNKMFVAQIKMIEEWRKIYDEMIKALPEKYWTQWGQRE